MYVFITTIKDEKSVVIQLRFNKSKHTFLFFTFFINLFIISLSTLIFFIQFHLFHLHQFLHPPCKNFDLTLLP